GLVDLVAGRIVVLPLAGLEREDALGLRVPVNDVPLVPPRGDAVVDALRAVADDQVARGGRAGQVVHVDARAVLLESAVVGDLRCPRGVHVPAELDVADVSPRGGDRL